MTRYFTGVLIDPCPFKKTPTGPEGAFQVIVFSIINVVCFCLNIALTSIFVLFPMPGQQSVIFKHVSSDAYKLFDESSSLNRNSRHPNSSTSHKEKIFNLTSNLIFIFTYSAHVFSILLTRHQWFSVRRL